MCLLPLVHCSLLPGLGGLVTQPLDSLGYVPLETALATCEAGARRDLEQEIARYTASTSFIGDCGQAINIYHLEQSFHVLDSYVSLVIPRVSLTVSSCQAAAERAAAGGRAGGGG